MAFPTIQYNGSSGSDSAASGSNAPTTAITDVSTGETISTATSTTQTFSSAVDLTGVLDDDSDCIFIATPSGERKLFQIVSFTGGVAACTAIVTTEAADGTDAGLSFAIGGVRQTLQADTSNRDWLDMGAGWTFEFEAGTYDLGASISVVAGTAADGFLRFQAASGASVTLRSTTNTHHFSASDGLHVRDVSLTTNSGTTTNTRGLYSSSTNSRNILFANVVIDGLDEGILGNFDIQGLFINVEVMNCTDYGVRVGRNQTDNIFMYACKLHDNGYGASWRDSGTNDRSYMVIDHCLIYDNTNDGLVAEMDASPLTVKNSTFHGNGGDGISVVAGLAVSLQAGFILLNNIFDSNLGYGVGGLVNTDNIMLENDYNAYRNNSSGPRNNLSAGPNDVTLTADPFTDQASGDFTLNNTAGGGAACRAAGYPDFLDIGAEQHEDAGGGSGGGGRGYPRGVL